MELRLVTKNNRIVEPVKTQIKVSNKEFTPALEQMLTNHGAVLERRSSRYTYYVAKGNLIGFDKN